MAVMISEDKENLIVTCCGDDTVYLTISKEEGGIFAYQCYMNGNFYRDQYGMFRTLTNKLKKIWAIIANKDYYYSDIVMYQDDFEQFKEFVNRF